jgi:hypothetical protein
MLRSSSSGLYDLNLNRPRILKNCFNWQKDIQNEISMVLRKLEY